MQEYSRPKHSVSVTRPPVRRIPGPRHRTSGSSGRCFAGRNRVYGNSPSFRFHQTGRERIRFRLHFGYAVNQPFFEADFLSLKDGQVGLWMKGKEIKYPLVNLSEADQAFIKEAAEKAEAERTDPEKALAQAKKLIADGTDCIDFGPESARTNREAISGKAEIARFHSVVENWPALLTPPLVFRPPVQPTAVSGAFRQKQIPGRDCF